MSLIVTHVDIDRAALNALDDLSVALYGRMKRTMTNDLIVWLESLRLYLGIKILKNSIDDIKFVGDLVIRGEWTRFQWTERRRIHSGKQEVQGGGSEPTHPASTNGTGRTGKTHREERAICTCRHSGGANV